MKAKTKLNSPAAIADFVMRDAGDIIVFVGPTLDYVDASGPGFVVATADKDMQLRVDLITDPGGMREAVALALSARRPLVLNLVEDSEYQLARLVASCWPGPNAEVFRRNIEGEPNEAQGQRGDATTPANC